MKTGRNKLSVDECLSVIRALYLTAAIPPIQSRVIPSRSASLKPVPTLVLTIPSEDSKTRAPITPTYFPVPSIQSTIFKSHSSSPLNLIKCLARLFSQIPVESFRIIPSCPSDKYFSNTVFACSMFSTHVFSTT